MLLVRPRVFVRVLASMLSLLISKNVMIPVTDQLAGGAFVDSYDLNQCALLQSSQMEDTPGTSASVRESSTPALGRAQHFL